MRPYVPTGTKRISKVSDLGGVERDFNKLKQDHGEARRHQEIPPFFV